MAGPLASMYREGQNMQDSNVASQYGKPQQVHGPANVHDPAEALVQELDAIISNKRHPLSNREDARGMKAQIRKAHEVSALAAEMDELERTGQLSDEAISELHGLRDELMLNLQENINASKLKSASGYTE